MAQLEAASLAKVACTGVFCMGMLSAFAAVIPVSVSIVRPFLRHPVASLAALSAASFPSIFVCAGIQWSSTRICWCFKRSIWLMIFLIMLCPGPLLLGVDILFRAAWLSV